MGVGGDGEVDGSESVRIVPSLLVQCPSLSQSAFTIPLATWIQRCGPGVGHTLLMLGGSEKSPTVFSGALYLWYSYDC